MSEKKNPIIIRGDGNNLVHDGIIHEKVIQELQKYEDGIFEKMNPKIRENGFLTEIDESNGEAELVHLGDKWPAAFIPAVAFSNPEMEGELGTAACSIVNTLDNGFVYAGVNPDGSTRAIGPVVTPCIVGNVSKPYGIYIPFNNKDAIINGVDFSLSFLEKVRDHKMEKPCICDCKNGDCKHSEEDTEW